jgi:hypothetical protein
MMSSMNVKESEKVRRVIFEVILQLWDKEEIQFRGFIFIFKFTSWLVLGIILC